MEDDSRRMTRRGFACRDSGRIPESLSLEDGLEQTGHLSREIPSPTFLKIGSVGDRERKGLFSSNLFYT